MSKLKNTMWFGAGMMFGEFVLRWFVHAGYLLVIGILCWRLFGQ